MKLTHELAVAFFAALCRGEHHIPGSRYKGESVKPYGVGFVVSHGGYLASYDDNMLTRLVLLAHERCVRVEVFHGGPNRVRIAIWGRERTGDIVQRHVTIEHAIERFREADEGRREEWEALTKPTCDDCDKPATVRLRDGGKLVAAYCAEHLEAFRRETDPARFPQLATKGGSGG